MTSRKEKEILDHHDKTKNCRYYLSIIKNSGIFIINTIKELRFDGVSKLPLKNRWYEEFI